MIGNTEENSTYNELISELSDEEIKELYYAPLKDLSKEFDGMVIGRGNIFQIKKNADIEGLFLCK